MAFNLDHEAAVSDLNQYWYSQPTIDALVAEIELRATSVAFLSTPSLYFNLKSDKVRANSKVFEFDRQWESDPGFVFYDYNAPDKVPVTTWEAFDMVVVDPPFITKEVWAKYAETVKLIAKKGAHLLFTSVIENHQVLEELLDTSLMVPAFRPSIPKLVYQYHCFTNFAPNALERPNPELPAEDASIVAARSLANDMRESQNAFKAQMVNRDRAGEQLLPQPTAARGQGSEWDEKPVASSQDPAMKWTTVPEGLTEYAGGAAAPAPEAAVKLSDEYYAVEARRAQMDKLRKLVDVVVKDVEMCLKHHMAVEADASKAADVAPHIATLNAQRDKNLAEMSSIADQLAQGDAKDASGVCKLVTNFCAEWQQPITTTDKYRELCADSTRKFKSPIFNRQKELLAEMKKIKARDVKAATA